MGRNRFNSYSQLGVGVGLRTVHYAEILEDQPRVGWFEIISENFLVPGGRPLHVLDRVLEHYPIVQHGVSMYFGSPEPVNQDYLFRLKDLIRRTKTPWLSDHLCWGSVDGTYSHDLLPLPYTWEAASRAAERIKRVQDQVGIPVAVENVSSYATFQASEMEEWQFLSEVVEQADCGILLDVNNIYVSATNHRFDPEAYLRGIPMERVAQIHLAGHSNMGEFLLDTHDHPVSDPVWSLYELALQMTGPTPTLLEWDASIPELKHLLEHAAKAQESLDAAVSSCA